MPRKTALLIGNDDYKDADLQRLVAPWKDVISLRDVLETLGGFEMQPPLYNASLVQVQTSVTRLFRSAGPEDTVLLYYTGHGLRDDRNALFFALPDTDPDLLPANALPASYLQDAMQQSPAPAQLVILDCCHSGAMRLPGGKRVASTEGLREADLINTDAGEVAAEGKYILTASQPDESAYERAGKSIFTRHLVEGLQDGTAAPDKDWISIQDLYAHVYQKVRASGAPQLPNLIRAASSPELVVARNPKPRRPIKKEILDGFWGTELNAALGATHQLIRIAEGPDVSQAADARAEMERRLELHETPILIADPIRAWLNPPPDGERFEVLERELDSARSDAEDARAKLDHEVRHHQGTKADFEEQLSGLRARNHELEHALDGHRAAIETAETKHDQQKREWQRALDEQTQQRTKAEGLSKEKDLKIGELKKQCAELQAKLDGVGTSKKFRSWGIGLTFTAFGAFTAILLPSLMGDVLSPKGSSERSGPDNSAQTNPPDSSQPSSTFADCDVCPEMVVLPSGTFTMGSPEDEVGHARDEGPQRDVTIARFALAATEVTFDQWQACVDDGGCQSNRDPSDRGWGRGTRPVINVSWNDAQEYIAWLNGQGGRRSLSPAELRLNGSTWRGPGRRRRLRLARRSRRIRQTTMATTLTALARSGVYRAAHGWCRGAGCGECVGSAPHARKC